MIFHVTIRKIAPALVRTTERIFGVGALALIIWMAAPAGAQVTGATLTCALTESSGGALTSTSSRQLQLAVKLAF